MRTSTGARSAADVVVDARWVGYTGIGRFLTSLLEGLHELEPPGRWTLWGPPAVESFCWPGATHHPARHAPLSLAGQRELANVPSGQITLWSHVIHPMLFRRSAVVLYDTIPLRWANPPKRLAFRAIYKSAVLSANAVLTISDATSARAIEDLAVRPAKLTRLPVPVNTSLADRVRERRRETAQDPSSILYVGQIAPHKNLERALLAFAASDVSGCGSFTLVGGRPESIGSLTEVIARLPPEAKVSIVPRCTDDELIDLYARAGLVVMPSLEEGFGLPAVEALDAGIPVCCSDIPSLREATRGFPEYFDPLDITDIARSMATTARRAQDGSWAEVERAWKDVVHPTARDLAVAVVTALEETSKGEPKPGS